MKIIDHLESGPVEVGDTVIYLGLPAQVKEVRQDNTVVLTYYDPGGVTPTQERVVPRTNYLLMRPALR